MLNVSEVNVSVTYNYLKLGAHFSFGVLELDALWSYFDWKLGAFHRHDRFLTCKAREAD